MKLQELQFSLFLLCLILTGCVGYRLTNKGGKQLLTDGTPLTVKPDARFSAQLVYTGCGGLAISSGTDAILTDPYYTGHNGIRMLTGMKPDTNTTLDVLKSISKQTGDAKINAVLVSHAHYDHLEDLPWMLRRDKVGSDCQIMGSPTAKAILDPSLNGRGFTDLNKQMHTQSPSSSNLNQWIPLPGNMRLLAIEGDHAPHFWKLHFMRCKKSKDCAASVKHAGSNKRTRAFKWKEGTTYAFLLDVISQENTDTLRIFIQTSSCNPPYGFPPAAELGRKKVDIAVLCAASYQWVDNYPESILSLLKPTKTLLVHRENFFRKMYKTTTASTVPGTNMRKLMKRLRKHYKVKTNEEMKTFLRIAEPLEGIKIDY